jgi:hypothetical protein
MRRLVREDAREFGARAVERDPPLPKKCAGMDRPAAVA